ncbi:two-component response regulator-like APRR2 isoform X1 [Cucurbita moschata]|uniref:Two-component response regulator-like APRR2 isoform X1 n=1 Tax=Cucurbita moschata TaxID=3662 RepID=A0A6J1EBR2_CUCMO|nr:two-component response regulator-like APRR2 isoform X1 [Cucurbita moschata]XP_022923415.1 two-component response regulator-like APRR2 isoform X1 [Cucurbita moschata]XP_022923416.1 two-component response regulator-like APRR2 isoform X1 [Cucurbita moschata]
MVCTASDLQGWKDFPKDLRVLLLDGDSSSSAEIRTKLEEMEYVVVTYYNENDALSAISSKPNTFHVAIVEVTTSSHDGNFKFLEAAKDLPTIMISNIHCLSTMMKCIALGAIEFLQKPLSEDKLRNIWQHVVHKAFNAGGSAVPSSLKPIKESVASILHLESENSENNNPVPKELEISSGDDDNDRELLEGSDKYPAPSTPQQKHGMRLVDDGDCQDQLNCLLEKECVEQDGESKSVETTCINSLGEGTSQVENTQLPDKEGIKEEENSADGCGAASNDDHEIHDQDIISSSEENKSKACGLGNSSGTKVSRKKLKVDWTPELHRKFVQAVEQLGVNQAIPSRILELMKVEGLTRHNVASHLQKYRMHKRHILPKQDDSSWSHSKDPMRKNCYPQRPVMAFPPPYHSNHVMPVAPIYPPWGHMACPSPSVQMWVSPGYPSWQPQEIWPWKSYPGMYADAWGCPVTPPPHSPLPSHLPQQPIFRFENADAHDKSYGIAFNPIELQLADEEIDKVVREAISKPWLPLPLGLKPPSTESVLSELSRQGISTVPSQINGSKLLQ